MSATGYTIEWLRLRQIYDERSRNPHLVAKVNQIIHSRSHIHIADLGAGIGSNFFFWVNKIQIPFLWDWIEVDPRFVGYANEFEIAVPQNGHLEIINSNFEKYLDHYPIPNLIMANALLDVLNATQLTFLFKYCLTYQVPLYASINYLQTIFIPAYPLDALYLELYDKHMIRRQESGYAIGPKIHRLIESLKPKIPILAADSVWNLSSGDEKIMARLLQYMEGSIPDLIATDEMKMFLKWIDVKKELLNNHKLKMQINHKDYLINHQLQSIR